MLTKSEYNALENKKKRDELTKIIGMLSFQTRKYPHNSVQLIKSIRFMV